MTVHHNLILLVILRSEDGKTWTPMQGRDVPDRVIEPENVDAMRRGLIIEFKDDPGVYWTGVPPEALGKTEMIH